MVSVLLPPFLKKIEALLCFVFFKMTFSAVKNFVIVVFPRVICLNGT